MQHRLAVLLAFSSLALGGCFFGRKDTVVIPGPDGGTVTTTAEGDVTEMTIKTPEGEIKMQGDGDEYKIETKDGTFSANSDVDQAVFGDLIYPGSKVKEDSTATTKAPGFEQHIVALETTDTINQIAAFYEGKSTETFTAKTNDGYSQTGKLPNGYTLTVGATEADGKREIALGLMKTE